MSFNAYLKKRQAEPSAIGDFARDWFADKSEDKPRSSKSFTSIERYLEAEGACRGCLEAAYDAWSQWQAAKG